MAATKINTVQILDSRIEPQAAPTYAVTIGPDQNQWYNINASGFTDSSISFNNLTTLGKDRAYLDTFELELEVEVTFTPHRDSKLAKGMTMAPPYGLFMPQSFPFNTVCDQIQVNINGGAFFSNPLQIIRAKERYWDERKIHESYGNVCPCSKPIVQDEMGYRDINKQIVSQDFMNQSRSRLFGLQGGYAYSSSGPFGTTNYAILDEDEYSDTVVGYITDNAASVSATDPKTAPRSFKVRWREPVMCSPFSSRYDATYGRPLYNITSIDLQFKMFGDLRNMFICVAPFNLDSWEVHIKNASLHYQVMTVTAPVPHDITVVPYRRYVPFITNGTTEGTIDAHGDGNSLKFSSNVYTLNEVPTAIWIFAAPQLSYFHDISQHGDRSLYFMNSSLCNTSNRLFGFLKKISISCGNTTQILDTAKPRDLYRIAKSNGCQDSYNDWALADPFDRMVKPQLWEAEDTYKPHNWQDGPNVAPSADQEEDDDTPDANFGYMTWSIAPVNQDVSGTTVQKFPDICPGAGSVLRLIPGVDIVLPEQRLIPGANANNIVFKVDAEYDFRFGGEKTVPVALWILFEYVGVATFTPGNCMVTMNPLGNGGVMPNAPVVAASDLENVSTTEGSGWLDTLKSIFSKANSVAKQTGIVGELLNYVPKVGPVLSGIAKKLGYGEDGVDDDDAGDAMGDGPAAAAATGSTTLFGRKRARTNGGNVTGGAIMGLGDFC